jgi:uncharacterized linocin/CFP29 family protein
MNHLLREIAPLDEATWRLIDDEASSRLQPALAARRLVDVVGPLGWKHSATDVGRATPVDGAPRPVVTARQRVVLPLVEVQAAVRLDREELLAATRGAVDVDLTPLDVAAAQLAATENAAVFSGWEAVGMTGIAAASTHAPLVHDGPAVQYADAVSLAVSTLKASGVDGPYALALGPDAWVRIIESSESGYPIEPRLREILGAHDAAGVDLYLEESFTFRVATPEAAIAIRTT